jgi:hypothetical protein
MMSIGVITLHKSYSLMMSIGVIALHKIIFFDAELMMSIVVIASRL